MDRLTGQPQPASIKLAINDEFKTINSLNLTWLDSNPIFGFYGVESFTGFEAGFEFPRIRTLSLVLTVSQN